MRMGATIPMMLVLAACLWLAGCTRPPSESDTGSDETGSTSSDAGSSADSADSGEMETTGDPACPGGHVHEGDLVITDATTAEDVACIEEVTGSLRVQDTLELEDLAFLSALRSVGADVNIGPNAALVTTEGLDGLRDVGGWLGVGGNPVLTDIRSLGGITTLEGLHVGENAVLTTLPKFGDLLIVGEPVPEGELQEPVQLGFLDNEMLVDFDDLAGAQPTAPDGVVFWIDGNANLQSLVGLSSFAGLGKGLHLEIRNNPSLGELPQLGPQAGNIELENLAALDGFSPFADVLELESLRLEDVGIADMQGLEALETITGSLHLGDCDPFDGPDALVSLAGLEGLRNLGFLVLAGNGKLADATALLGLDPAATEVVWITDNPELPAEQAQALVDLLVEDADPHMCGNGGEPLCGECPPQGE